MRGAGPRPAFPPGCRGAWRCRLPCRRSVPRPGGLEGRHVPRRWSGGDEDAAATWPCRGGGGQPRVERGPRAPRRRRGARDSRAGSPVAGERLEQEVYGAALSDANGLKPIKRDGFM